MYGPAATPWVDRDFADRFPDLHEWLSLDHYDDGSPRVTCTLTIMVDAGALKLFLNDRDNNRSACVNAASFDEALDQLDRGLKNDSLHWTVKRQYNTTNGKVPY